MLYARKVVPIPMIRYIAVGFMLCIFDQITKLYAVNYFKQPIRMSDMVSFELVFNRGISWGLGHDAGPIAHTVLLGLIGSCILGLFLYIFVRHQNHESIAAELMIAAGAVSNLFDRVIYGAVVDFIAVSVSFFSWPIFNIADVLIVLGVLFLGIRLMQDGNQR